MKNYTMKQYVPMGYITTFGNDRVDPVVYILPWNVCVWVMNLKNYPKDERPAVVDLTEYGYGYESLSMIRSADKYENKESEVEFFIYTLPSDLKDEARRFYEDRKGNKLITTVISMRNRRESLDHKKIE